MFRKLSKSALVSLVSLIGACSSNGDAIKETDLILNKPIRTFAPLREKEIEELALYKRGPIQTENISGYVLTYPLTHRDASKLIETVKPIFPECVFIADINTNQLVVRIPYVQTDSKNSDRGAKLTEVKKFIGDIDVQPPQYTIQTYTMQVSADKLNSVRSSLDLLVESGNVQVALNSINKSRQEEGGITHTISGVLGGIIPTLKISALFDGLERHGYVYNLSQTTTTVDEGEPAQVTGTRKIPIPEIYPSTPPVTGYKYTDVTQNLRVVPRSRIGNSVELDLEVSRANVLPTSQDTNHLPINDISTRMMKTKINVPLGDMLFLATALEDTRKGLNESSPLSSIIGSSSAEGQIRTYEVTAVIASRIDYKKQGTGLPKDMLDEQINRDGNIKQNL